MKNLCFAFSFVFFATDLHAERYDITANIGQIRYHEAGNTLASRWRDDVWFSLLNPNKQPECTKYGGAFAIAIPAENDEAFSMVLAAKMAGKEVLVTIDDAVKMSGTTYCQLQYITIL